MMNDQPASEDYSAPPPNPFKGQVCPKCGGDDVRFHLMMRECDECLRHSASLPDPYITVRGIIVPNPDRATRK